MLIGLAHQRTLHSLVEHLARNALDSTTTLTRRSPSMVPFPAQMQCRRRFTIGGPSHVR